MIVAGSFPMSTTGSTSASVRLASLDAFRGLTMLYMASEIWRISAVARMFPDSAVWQFIAYHTSHAAWTGGSAWDMIQPSFMFMVGVALPWSVANRRARGQGLKDLWAHALWRSLILVSLGIFLRSVSRPMTNFTFEDVLTQIGLGYPFLFFLAWKRPRVQAIAAALILVGYWAAFALYPAPGPDFDFARVGVPPDWPHHLKGFAAHWDKNSNFGAAVDTWFMNLFPRQKPFVFNGGGYLTPNFIPSLATMIFGLLAGGLLKSERSWREKLRLLLGAGLAGIVVGWLLGVTGICPVVKRIWTPSWALLSSGWVLVLLAGFYWLIDVKGKVNWSYGLRAVGMNSIAMYTMTHLWDSFLASSFKVHLGWNVLSALPEPVLTTAVYFLAWCVLWWFCIWMDRKRLYIRI